MMQYPCAVDIHIVYRIPHIPIRIHNEFWASPTTIASVIRRWSLAQTQTLILSSAYEKRKKYSYNIIVCGCATQIGEAALSNTLSRELSQDTQHAWLCYCRMLRHIIQLPCDAQQ